MLPHWKLSTQYGVVVVVVVVVAVVVVLEHTPHITGQLVRSSSNAAQDGFRSGLHQSRSSTAPWQLAAVVVVVVVIVVVVVRVVVVMVVAVVVEVRVVDVRVVAVVVVVHAQQCPSARLPSVRRS